MTGKKSSGNKAAYVKLQMLLDKLKGKKILILDLEEITFIPYMLPIYKSLREKTKNISYYLATHYPGNELYDIFEVPLSRQFSVSMSREFSRADIFLSPHIYGAGNSMTIKIHINHNQPVKYESYQKTDFINFDIHFLTSPLHREQTENTIDKYGLKERNIKLYDIGYSKSDALLRGEYNREETLKELKLNPARKTVLYAPSWDEGLSLRNFGEEVIERLLSVDNINVIVKLHPISYCPEDGPNYEFYTGGVNWIDRFSKYESHKNFRHIPANSIDPLLAAADIMVTDVSSVALEFIMLDKPVIYIDCPEFFEKTLKKTYSNFGNTTADFVRNDPKANAGRHVGDVVYDLSELSETITRVLNNPDEKSELRREFSKRLIYNPGKAADTAADKILEILEI